LLRRPVGPYLGALDVNALKVGNVLDCRSGHMLFDLEMNDRVDRPKAAVTCQNIVTA
jgi:hypothetical protein